MVSLAHIPVVVCVDGMDTDALGLHHTYPPGHPPICTTTSPVDAALSAGYVGGRQGDGGAIYFPLAPSLCLSRCCCLSVPA